MGLFKKSKNDEPKITTDDILMSMSTSRVSINPEYLKNDAKKSLHYLIYALYSGDETYLPLDNMTNEYYEQVKNEIIRNKNNGIKKQVYDLQIKNVRPTNVDNTMMYLVTSVEFEIHYIVSYTAIHSTFDKRVTEELKVRYLFMNGKNYPNKKGYIIGKESDRREISSMPFDLNAFLQEQYAKQYAQQNTQQTQQTQQTPYYGNQNYGNQTSQNYGDMNQNNTNVQQYYSQGNYNAYYNPYPYGVYQQTQSPYGQQGATFGQNGQDVQNPQYYQYPQNGYYMNGGNYNYNNEQQNSNQNTNQWVGKEEVIEFDEKQNPTIVQETIAFDTTIVVANVDVNMEDVDKCNQLIENASPILALDEEIEIEKELVEDDAKTINSNDSIEETPQNDSVETKTKSTIEVQEKTLQEYKQENKIEEEKIEEE